MLKRTLRRLNKTAPTLSVSCFWSLSFCFCFLCFLSSSLCSCVFCNIMKISKRQMLLKSFIRNILQVRYDRQCIKYIVYFCIKNTLNDINVDDHHKCFKDLYFRLRIWNARILLRARIIVEPVVDR